MLVHTLISMMPKIALPDPGQIGSLIARYETKNLSGYSNGASVTSFPDAKSLYNATGSATYRSADGGYLEFNGTSDFFTTGITTALGDLAAVAVVRFRSLSAFQRVFDKSYDTGYWGGVNAGGNAIGGGIRETDAPYGSFVSASANVWYALLVERTGSAKRVRLSGTLAQSFGVPATSTSTDPLLIGKANDGSGYGAIDLKAFFPFGDNLSSGEFSIMADYISDNYGLAL